VVTRADSKTRLVGVISDTHGLLRPEAVEALKGSELIVHAGDIGGPEIIEALRAIAPVVAVRGNNDRGRWAEEFPLYDVAEVGATYLYVLHDLKELDLSPEAAGFRVVVSGHSHKPLAEERRGVLYLNPGSAGPRRFKLPVTIARLNVGGGDASAEIVELLT
jgi:putative phosphoesterase